MTTAQVQPLNTPTASELTKRLIPLTQVRLYVVS